MRHPETPERRFPRDSPRRTAPTNGYRRDGRTQLTAYEDYGRNRTPLEHMNWPTYTFIDIFAYQLPKDVTTLELYRNLHHYGNINRIEIHLDRDGNPAGRAVIRFKPPPGNSFWELYNEHNFKRYEGKSNIPCGSTKVRFKFDNNQRIHFVVESPTRPGVKYDEECILLASSIDFGVLLTPSSMMIMETKKSFSPTGQVKMVLNLHKSRMEIEINFPHMAFSDNRPQGMRRDYRFTIALDQAFSIFETKQKDRSASFILNLDSPPPFKRKLNQSLADSHNDDDTRWFEDDSWTRQTDVVRHKNDFDVIDTRAVAVRKDLNCINIGRWNAFRITISDHSQEMDPCRIFRGALQDYNVAVQDVEDFVLIRETVPPEPLVWTILDDIDNEPSEQSRDDGNWLSRTLDRVYLSFPVRYQLEVCISHGWINEYNVDLPFLETLSKMPEHRAKQFLVCVASRGKRFFNPMEIFDDLDFRRPIKKPRIPEACVEMYHATVTATNILYNTPSVEMTNRVVRQYKQFADRFLRVRFEDDEYRGNTKIFASSNNKMDLVLRRVKRTLRHGIKFGGRHYEFLAWGNSQMREHGAYFFASGSNTPTAGNIRAVMGEFDHERVVAKRAARIGQCFSTTKAIQLRLPRVTRDNLIPDIVRGKYTFSDGVGQISQTAASIAAHQLKIPGPVPSVLQFRLGGCKGILAVSPTLKGTEIKVRKSQFKFKSNSGELEIIRPSEFWHSYLNRQLILVLSELGVPDHVFLTKQRQEIEELRRATENDQDAINALRDRVDPNRMTLVVADLVAAGFMQRKDPFMISILGLWRAWCLKYLKEKAKLPVPKGAFVLGCVDETETLHGHFQAEQLPSSAKREDKLSVLPEIFLQITDSHTGEVKVIKETCILARNPSLHPGDIRVVKAVDVPALRHLRDVVVMPQTGDRDLPSMCSGGDLDGDDYIVIWDASLIPEIVNAEPFHYNPPTPLTAHGEITQEDFITFFCDYMKNDFLGRIAHAHLGWADFLNSGIQSDQCMELVRLHSMAVDYPKTGVPAIMHRKLSPQSWPHFMEKRAKTHGSDKILGQLYDQVERVKFKPSYTLTFDTRILNAHIPSQITMAHAQHLKHEYDRAMQRIMAQHSIKTEFEIWTTFVLDHSKAAPDYKFHEEIGQLSKALKDQYYESIVEIVGSRDRDSLAPFAVAAYKITQGEVAAALQEVERGERSLDTADMPFITFPWILHDVLTRIATTADQQQTSDSTFVVDGNLVAATNVPELDNSGAAVFDAMSSQTFWGGQPLTGTHFDRRFGDPYRPSPAAASKPEAELEAEPASTESLDSPEHVSQDSSSMLSQIQTLPSTSAGSLTESNNPTSPQNPESLIGINEEDERFIVVRSDEPAVSKSKAAAATNSICPLASIPLRLKTQNMPPSPTGYIDEHGVYRSPFRRRSAHSSSPGGLQGNRSGVGESLSELSTSTTTPSDTKSPEHKHQESRVFGDPASDPSMDAEFMARFAAPEGDDW